MSSEFLPCGTCNCANPECETFIEEGKGVMLLSCFHPFCRDCLSDLVRGTDAYQIQCPLAYGNLQKVKCGGYMSLKEIREVITENEFEDYCSRSGHNYKKFQPHLQLESKSEDKIDVLDAGAACRLSDSNSNNSNGENSEKPIKNSSAMELGYQPSTLPIPALTLKLTKNETMCSFCYEPLKSWEGIILQTCAHVFCRLCLETCIKNSNGSQIKCLMDDETSCNGFLLDREIKSVVSEEFYTNYKEKSETLAFNGIPNIYQCTFDGCYAKCSVEDTKKVFVCPICNSKNCLACKAIHDGVECDDYQRLLKNAVSSGKDIKTFQEELDKELDKNGFGQLAKKFSKWKQTTGAGSTQSDFEIFLDEIALKGLFLSDVEFECSICYNNVEARQGMILQECLHCFCRNCLIDVVKHSDTPEVKCPSQDCICFLTPREIKALVPEEVYENHLTRSVRQAENVLTSFHCKTPDCMGWCEIEREDQDGKFVCYVCKKPNCFKCKAIHGDISCEDYQNQLVQTENDLASQNALNNLVNSGECMKCPTCKVVVQKIAGCDWLICSLCKTEICWATKGPRWGPRGPGDLSGGCRCKVNGPLCTPNCGNCH